MNRNLGVSAAVVALGVLLAWGLFGSAAEAQEPAAPAPADAAQPATPAPAPAEPAPAPAAAAAPVPAAAPPADATQPATPAPADATQPATPAPAGAAPAAGAAPPAAEGAPSEPAAESPEATAAAARAAAEELNQEEGEEAPADAAAAAPAPVEDTLPVTGTLSSSKTTIDGILRSGTIPAASATAFDDYFKKYALARWTDPKLRSQLHALRQRHRADLMMAKEPAHTALVKLTLEVMQELIRPDKNYHPAVRGNAMLMIGELNSVERGVTTAATPSPEALKVMLDVVDAAKGAKYSEGVKVAALVGLRRHAEAGRASMPQAATVTKAMLAILAAKAPGNRPAEGHYWMQGQACEILGLIGLPGDKSIIVRALDYTLRSETAPANTRAAAASALGRIKLVPEASVNATQLAANTAQFVADVCDAELALYERFEPIYRRRVKAAIQAALLALNGDPKATPPTTGIKGLAASPGATKYVGDVEKRLNDLLATLEDEELYEEEVIEDIQKAADDFVGMIEKKPAG